MNLFKVGFVFMPVFFLLVCPFISLSQDMTYAREVINVLTSPEMDGRGYVNKGDAKAAKYIQAQYEKIGLQPLNNVFYQSFTLPVNTFPSNMKLLVDGSELTPGVDYIVHPSTKSITTKNKLLAAKHKIKSVDDVRSQFRSGYINVMEFDSLINGKDRREVMEYLGRLKYGDGTIILEPKKLTWSVSNYLNKKPIIYVLKSAWKNNAERISIVIKSKLIRDYESQNVIGYIPGLAEPDSFVFVTAHYDHLGRMGDDTYFPGANDNASGVSMLLQLAKHYSSVENKPHYSTVFICFAGEEAGLVGSKYFVESKSFSLNKIKFLLNMDLLGTGEEGITVVNGSIFEKEFASLQKINEEKEYLVNIKKRGKAANSDHYFFTEAGVPAFFFYTLGGISAYHDVFDIADTLPLTEYEDVFKLFVDFVESLH